MPPIRLKFHPDFYIQIEVAFVRAKPKTFALPCCRFIVYVIRFTYFMCAYVPYDFVFSDILVITGNASNCSIRKTLHEWEEKRRSGKRRRTIKKRAAWPRKRQRMARMIPSHWLINWPRLVKREPGVRLAMELQWNCNGIAMEFDDIINWLPIYQFTHYFTLPDRSASEGDSW